MRIMRFRWITRHFLKKPPGEGGVGGRCGGDVGGVEVSLETLLDETQAKPLTSPRWMAL